MSTLAKMRATTMARREFINSELASARARLDSLCAERHGPLPDCVGVPFYLRDSEDPAVCAQAYVEYLLADLEHIDGLIDRFGFA